MFESEKSDISKTKKNRNLALSSLNQDDDIEMQAMMQNMIDPDEELMRT